MFFRAWGVRLVRRGNDDVADDVSTDNKSDGRMTRVVMDGWVDECMDGWVLDDEMWARGGAAGRGSYSISLRDAAKQSLEKMHKG